jgi:DNA-binding IclR family transcriptional regulator
MEATYLMTFASSQPLRFMVEIGGQVRSLYATSAGKALLGGLDDEKLSAFLRTVKMTRLTPRTLTTKEALRADIDASNARGWFLNDGESLDGVTTLSARLAWTSSTYIVTIAAPSPRILPRLEEAAGLLTHVCKLLGSQPGVGTH